MGRLARSNGPGLNSVWVSHSALIIATEQVTVLKRWFLAKGVVVSNRPAKHSFRAQCHCAIAHNRNSPRPSTHMPSSLHSAWLRCHYADPGLATLPNRRSGGSGTELGLHPDTQNGRCLPGQLREFSREEVQAKAPHTGFTEVTSSLALL